MVPNELAITPLPTPLITPPVTKMYFIIMIELKQQYCTFVVLYFLQARLAVPQHEHNLLLIVNVKGSWMSVNRQVVVFVLQTVWKQNRANIGGNMLTLPNEVTKSNF